MPSIFFFSARAQAAAAGVFSNEKHAQLRTMNRNESARRFSWPRAPSGRQMMSNKQGCTHWQTAAVVLEAPHNANIYLQTGSVGARLWKQCANYNSPLSR